MTTPITPEMRELLEEMSTLTRGIDKCRHSMTNILEQAKPSGVWKPEMGDTVWVWDETYPVTRGWDNQIWNQIFFATDQIHPTAEACQHAHDKRVAQVKYERLAEQAWIDDGKVCDWEDKDQSKFENQFYHDAQSWEIFETWSYQFACLVPFPTRQSATAAREAMGADMYLLL